MAMLGRVFPFGLNRDFGWLSSPWWGPPKHLVCDVFFSAWSGTLCAGWSGDLYSAEGELSADRRSFVWRWYAPPGSDPLLRLECLCTVTDPTQAFTVFWRMRWIYDNVQRVTQPAIQPIFTVSGLPFLSSTSMGFNLPGTGNANVQWSQVRAAAWPDYPLTPPPWPKNPP